MSRPVKNTDELLLVHIDMATRKADHDPLLSRKPSGSWKVALIWLAVVALVVLYTISTRG